MVRLFASIVLCFSFANAHADDSTIEMEMPVVNIPDPNPVLDFLADIQSELDSKAQQFNFLWYANHVDLQKETKCLAQNVYYEARGEDIAGEVAVALVTINRVKSFFYPPSICDVVYQQGQFSWTKHHTKKTQPKDQDKWDEAITIAAFLLDGGRLDNVKDITQGSLSFHATYVHPRDWKKYWDKTVQIGNHIFFRSKKEVENRDDPVVMAQE